MDPHWVYSGSSVSGIGYGYSIMTNVASGITSPEFAVSLGFAGIVRIVPCGSWSDAVELGERFANAWRAYRVVRERERVLSLGFAIIG